jgi:hypothetical protein
LALGRPRLPLNPGDTVPIVSALPRTPGSILACGPSRNPRVRPRPVRGCCGLDVPFGRSLMSRSSASWRLRPRRRRRSPRHPPAGTIRRARRAPAASRVRRTGRRASAASVRSPARALAAAPIGRRRRTGAPEHAPTVATPSWSVAAARGSMALPGARDIAVSRRRLLPLAAILGFPLTVGGMDARREDGNRARRQAGRYRSWSSSAQS